MLTPRLKELKRTIIEAEPRVYAERALLVTQAYGETEKESPNSKRARAMELLLGKITVLVKEQELLVGSKTPTPMGSPLYPEFNCKWIEDEIDTLADRSETAFAVSEGTKKILKEEVIPFWKGNTVADKIVQNVPPKTLEALKEGLFFHYYLNRSIGHITVDYKKVLEQGYSGIRKDVEKKLRELDGTAWDSFEKRDFYESLLRVIDAIVLFAGRHAEEAESLAAVCEDAARKKELLEIARICRKVPEKPAETFYEALQSFWFVHLVLNLESNGYAISPGRFDQYIYPFYAKDLAKGHISPEKAQELLNCLWIKFAELTVAKEGGTAKASNTYADFQNLNVGGLREDGSDGVNDISYMCIQAQMDLLLPQPQLSCLVSTKSPQEFLLKACELARMGSGMPAIYNADELIVALLDKGKTLADARNGAINGCVEITGQGNDHMASSGYVNLSKCLNLALNNGISLTSGKQWGPETGNPEDFQSMEDIWKAFEIQIDAQVALKHGYDNGARAAFAEMCPVHCTSLVMNACVAKGKDYHKGGSRYNQPMMCGVGTGTVADSLAAIEYFVFTKKAFSLKEIVNAMKDNFNEHETLRNLLWNKAPKYGNDNQFADKHAVRLVRTFGEILKKYRNQENVPYAANMIPTTTHLPFGELTGATPDGRRATEPTAEGISPVQGKDTSGPTAVVQTMGKLDHASTAGSLLNMKFTPKTLEGEEGIKKFAALIRTYFDMGGHHMQFNVVSRETLLDAQKHPESYRNLLIRVAGYSDYFVMLSKDVQDEVISRTSHEI